MCIRDSSSTGAEIVDAGNPVPTVGVVTITNATGAAGDDAGGPEETGPIAVEGYYPLYNTEAGANAASPDGTGNHPHELNGITYYMPNGLNMNPDNGAVTQWHGDYGADAVEYSFASWRIPPDTITNAEGVMGEDVFLNLAIPATIMDGSTDNNELGSAAIGFNSELDINEVTILGG